MKPPEWTESTALSRRRFLLGGSALCAASFPGKARTAPPVPAASDAEDETPERNGAITASTIAEAQKLAALDLVDSERQQVAGGIRRRIARFERRRKQPLANALAPATVFRPLHSGGRVDAEQGGVKRSADDAGPCPGGDEDIAFAPLSALSRWIERKELRSEQLTRLYLERLKRFGPRLECVVTLTEELALRQAKQADAEIAAGKYRGPLHGIPWGAKDLFDTAGIPTTWGATPYKNRVPATDAAVVERLAAAGAVLVAKTTLGALAYGDIWFGGKTRSPWNTARGSSGSSAGSAAATAAGLVGFSLGTETLGSIVSPCMRCGTTGLRPTFGRVPRSGAMALCWSLDKIGPICRRVEDTALVLSAIHGAHDGDPSSVDRPFVFDAGRSLGELRVGYSPSWFDGPAATDVDRQALDAARRLGLALVELEFPDWPYDALMTILEVEAAAAFEELTLTNRDDELVWQEPNAWPNSFRKTWFTPAVEFVQAQRFRRRVAEMMADRFSKVDAMIGPSYAGSMLLITNNTGHPSLTLRAGFRSDGEPHGITLWGRLFDEGTICALGAALETELAVWDRRPSTLSTTSR